MLRPRIIPCLLVHKKGLVKTVGFKSPKYVGNPIISVRIFNEKQVDEMMVLDIDASSENRRPDYRMIEYLAAECRMPLSYGGGVKTVEQAQRIFSLGVEKIAMSSAIFADPTLIKKMAEQVGAQSVAKVREATSLPLTVLAGAGTLEDIGKLIKRYGIIGAAAGSLFVFKGVYKAVLISYPDPREKKQLISENLRI